MVQREQNALFRNFNVNRFDFKLNIADEFSSPGTVFLRSQIIRLIIRCRSSENSIAVLSRSFPVIWRYEIALH